MDTKDTQIFIRIQWKVNTVMMTSRGRSDITSYYSYYEIEVTVVLIKSSFFTLFSSLNEAS